MGNLKLLLIFILSFALFKSYGQKKTLVYIATYSSEEELKKIFESVKKPLLIYNNIVYEMDSDCLITAFGGSFNDRNAGGDANERNKSGTTNDRNSSGVSNDRNSGGGSIDRNDGGYSNDRSAGGNSNNRNAGGNSNSRNAGGNINDRSAGGNVNDRNAGGELMDFSCEVDKKGKLTIYFKELKKDETLKIYYNYLFYTNQYFKIKKT
jgi:hypothetical protein